jgi:hypothetical protein
MTSPLSIATTAAGAELSLLPGLANRHGLITGATGTGKTVTLQVMAERLMIFGSTGPRGGVHEGILGSAARSAARSMGSSVGRSVIRGVLGSILGGK